MFYNGYPYTNFHDLNLDWILAEVKKAVEKTDSIPAAVARAVDGLQGFYITPEMYGAVGDGQTDDSAAIQTAVAAAALLGVPCWLTKRQYRTTQQINVVSNSVILGTGSVVMPSNDVRAFGIVNAEYVVIDGINVTYTDDPNSLHAHGYYIVNSRHVRVSNSIVRSNRSAVVSFNDENSPSEYLHIENVSIIANPSGNAQPNYMVGFLMANVHNSEIVGCRAEGVTHFTFEFKNDCRDSVFRDCVARNCNFVFYAATDVGSGAVPGVRRLTYINCRAYDCTFPFVVGNSYDVSFIGCSAFNTMATPVLTVSGRMEGLVVDGLVVVQPAGSTPLVRVVQISAASYVDGYIRMCYSGPDAFPLSSSNTTDASRLHVVADGNFTQMSIDRTNQAIFASYQSALTDQYPTSKLTNFYNASAGTRLPLYVDTAASNGERFVFRDGGGNIIKTWGVTYAEFGADL